MASFRQLMGKLWGTTPNQPASGVREVLFGDVPTTQWPRPDSTVRGEEPWAWFAAAQQAVAQADSVTAERHLRRVLAAPGLETRHYLQAWHALRELGQVPAPAEAQRVLGVVVEVALPQGLDLVAAYEDGTARYFNYSGAGVVWERPDDSLETSLRKLLATGQEVALKIGPWLEARPPAPANGLARVSMLTPSGLHFGQAPFEVLWQDPMGGQLLADAQALMQALMAKHPPAQDSPQ